MSLKICFLSLLHRFDDTRVFYKEARSLAQAGFEVVHLTSGKMESHWKDGVRIEIYYPEHKKGIRGRLVKFFPLYRRAVEINADCYHCNEIESWPAGCLIKLFHWDKRIIFDVHEHYPSRFDHSPFPKWLGWIAEPATLLLYRLLIPWTDHLIFANHSIAPDLPGAEHKQSFIYNYSTLRLQSRQIDDVPPSIRQEFTGRLIAIHVGDFGRTRGWPQLLHALTLMKCQQLEVLCMGDLEEGKAMLAEAQRLGVAERIRLKGRVPYEQMFDYLLCADVGLMLYQPGIQNHVFASPIKIFDYMLAGLPVIAPDFAIEIEPVVRAEKCGLLVNPTEPEQIAQALDWLCENPALAREMGQRGRQAVIRKYNWEAEAQKLIKIYSKFAVETAGR